MRLFALAAIGLWLAVAPAAGAQSESGVAEQSIRVGAATRIFLVANIDTASAPRALVIALHGGGGNARTMIPRWLDTAHREGFAVAFPDGVGRMERMGTWNAGGCCGHAMTSRSDDIAFISVLIDELVRTQNVDPRRVYVTGLSNGGMLAHRVGVELSDKVAAIAVVAGAMFGGEQAPATPLPVLIMHGERDEIVPFAGGESPMRLVAHSQGQPFRPVSYAVDFWRRADACSPEATTTTSGGVTVETFASCRDGAEVVFYRLASAGHTWPGAAVSSVAIERTPYTEIDASEVIWDFFERHSR